MLLMLTRNIRQVCQQNLSALWNVVVSKTKQPGYKEYEDVLLVVVYDHLAAVRGGIRVGMTSGRTQGGSLDQAMKIWKRNVDMHYVPKGNMEYRVEGTWRV